MSVKNTHEDHASSFESDDDMNDQQYDQNYDEDYSSNSSDTTSPPNSSISTGSSPSSSDDEGEDDEHTLMLLQANALKKTSGRRRNRNQNPAQFCSRESSLGEMKSFTDKMLLMVAQYLLPRDLVNLGYCSWMFFVVSHDEPIWRALVLNLCVDRRTKIGNFCFHGTWRRTMMHPRRFPGKSHKQQNPAPLTHNDEDEWHSVRNKKMTDEDCSSSASSSSYWMIDSPHKPHYAKIRKTDSMKWYDKKTFKPGEATMYLGGVERRSKLSYLEFVEQYERPNRPVIITDVADDWPAKFKWQEKNFVKYYGETLFNINCRSTKGYRFRMRMFDFLAYCDSCNGEKYMYVFDKFIFKRDRKQRIINDFKIPDYFKQDLFDLMDDVDRPDYRWMLVGPDGSGSPFHTDPHASSAWNCVLSGAKRVTFYPPHICPPGTDKNLLDDDVYPSDENMYWYRYRLPRTAAKHPNLKPIECVVFPGEMLFIPSMWWHSVMNIGTTIAVTQNFCSLQTFPYVAHDMNATSGRAIRQDFKCGLAESQFKPLADYIVIHKKRPEQQQIMRTVLDSVINHYKANGYSGAVNLLYWPQYGKKKRPVPEDTPINDTNHFVAAAIAATVARKDKEEQQNQQQNGNGNGHHHHHGENYQDAAVPSTTSSSSRTTNDFRTISSQLVKDFDNVVIGSSSTSTTTTSSSGNGGGVFGKIGYGNHV